MVEIPKYFEACWRQYRSPHYGRMIAVLSGRLGLNFAPDRPPFICVGDLDSSEEKIVTFALAPNSRNSDSSDSLAEYYLCSRDYFDQPQIPHRMHVDLAKLCWGALGVAPPPHDQRSRWLHENGYLSFDMLPYYVRSLRGFDCSRQVALRLIRRHFRQIALLLQVENIRFILFTGKPWLVILAGGGLSGLGQFTTACRLRLSEITGKAHHRCEVRFGSLDLGQRSGIPTLILGHLVQAIRGMDDENLRALGDRFGSWLRHPFPPGGGGANATFSRRP